MEEIAQAFGECEYPLTYGDLRKYVVNKMSGGLDCLRRVVHDEQIPLPLQEKAIKKSCAE